jgi:predicted lipid carrier protein YhbT
VERERGSVATRAQVRAKLRAVIARLEDADPEVHGDIARTLSEPRIVQVDVPDLEASFWAELSGGRLGPLHDGEADRVDIRVTADGGDLVEMLEGKRNLFSSYMAGHIKVQASLSDLLALRRLG